MNTLSHLEHVAEELVRRGLEHARDVEVRITRGDGYGYELRGETIAPQVSLGRVQVGIRALTGDGMALSATTTLDVDENLTALRASLESARPTPIERFAGEEAEMPAPAPDAGWEAWRTDAARLKTLAAGMRDTLYQKHGKSGRLESFEGAVAFSTESTVLATSAGHHAFDRTNGFGYVSLNGTHSRVHFLERAPDEAARESLRRLGLVAYEEMPERMMSPAELGVRGEVDAILHPRLVEGMIRIAAQEKFLGSSRKSGLSRFEDGQPVWDPSLSLEDTGVEPGLATSRPIDDELVPTRTTPLVSNGRFAGRVWSRRSASEDDAKTTGNGYRKPMLVEDPNEAPVRDALSGLVMAAGEKPLDTLISEMDRGIYVIGCLGLHGADRARASFSAAAYDGFVVEGGKIVALVMPGTWNVSGHLFPEDGSKGIFGDVTVSREREVTGSAKLPWMRTRVGI